MLQKFTTPKSQWLVNNKILPLPTHVHLSLWGALLGNYRYNLSHGVVAFSASLVSVIRESSNDYLLDKEVALVNFLTVLELRLLKCPTCTYLAKMFSLEIYGPQK